MARYTQHEGSMHESNYSYTVDEMYQRVSAMERGEAPLLAVPDTRPSGASRESRSLFRGTDSANYHIPSYGTFAPTVVEPEGLGELLPGGEPKTAGKVKSYTSYNERRNKFVFCVIIL
jgi:hypothetical protein